jgi:hypothetical protein
MLPHREKVRVDLGSDIESVSYRPKPRNTCTGAGSRPRPVPGRILGNGDQGDTVRSDACTREER